MRVVFLGTGDIGVPALRALIDSGHEVAAVVTQPDRPAGRDLRPRASAVKLVAAEHGISVLQPEKLRDPASVEALLTIPADVFVVIAYGQILPQRVLDLPRLACLNVHASILPRHRGASPIHAAILSGERETGVTIMYMDAGLDTGDILLIEKTPILPGESAGELHDRLAALAPAPMLRSLELLEAGEAPRIPQDSAFATYAPKLAKEDGAIDWTLDATAILRHIRGMTPWPGAFARLEPSGEVLKVHAAEIAQGGGEAGCVIPSSGALTVAAGRGAVRLVEVQLPGRKKMPAGDFLRGFPRPDEIRFQLRK